MLATMSPQEKASSMVIQADNVSAESEVTVVNGKPLIRERSVHRHEKARPCWHVAGGACRPAQQAAADYKPGREHGVSRMRHVGQRKYLSFHVAVCTATNSVARPPCTRIARLKSGGLLIHFRCAYLIPPNAAGNGHSRRRSEPQPGDLVTTAQRRHRRPHAGSRRCRLRCFLVCVWCLCFFVVFCCVFL